MPAGKEIHPGKAVSAATNWTIRFGSRWMRALPTGAVAPASSFVFPCAMAEVEPVPKIIEKKDNSRYREWISFDCPESFPFVVQISRPCVWKSCQEQKSLDPNFGPSKIWKRMWYFVCWIWRKGNSSAALTLIRRANISCSDMFFIVAAFDVIHMMRSWSRRKRNAIDSPFLIIISCDM